MFEKLEWPSRNDDYYANLKDGEIYYGYVIKSPYSDALTSGGDNIVIRTNNIINHLNILLIFSNILSLAYVIYWIFKNKVEGTFNVIDKNKMKWLILKLLFIFALSLFMAIPISYGVIEAFNNSYIVINKLYSIDILAIVISSLINFGIVVIGYLCILFINKYILKRD